MELPIEFKKEMQIVLGEDADRYFESFDKPAFRGISINRLKTNPEKLLPLLPFGTEKSPFYRDGYYIPENTAGIGRHALHHAGAFYVQEPSASCAVGLLEIEKGDRVLDLCAAPGGKSSQIASMLGGSGLVWSNEVVKNRAGILLSNFERMGIASGVVSSCYPDELCSKLSGWFDKVLVDAPCSGEGMFRKDNNAVQEWSREHVLSCAARQLEILKSAVAALREGGVLVYSTCTFSPEENEMTVCRLLEECPELEPYDIKEPFGRKTSLPNAARITPLEGGEGHFAARFRKCGGAARREFRRQEKKDKRSDCLTLGEEMLEDIFVDPPKGCRIVRNDKLFIVPDFLPDLSGLGVIRAGFLAGEMHGRRFEPSHSLFTCAAPQKLRRTLELSCDDPACAAFLHGEETDCDGQPGYTGVVIDGMTVGFGKCSGGRLKNKYPKGLRNC